MDVHLHLLDNHLLLERSHEHALQKVQPIFRLLREPHFANESNGVLVVMLLNYLRRRINMRHVTGMMTLSAKDVNSKLVFDDMSIRFEPSDCCITSIDHVHSKV